MGLTTTVGNAYTFVILITAINVTKKALPNIGSMSSVNVFIDGFIYFMLRSCIKERN